MRPPRGRAFLVSPPPPTEQHDQLLGELLEVCTRLLKQLEALHECEDRDLDIKKRL